MLAGEAWEQEQDPAVHKVEKEKDQEVGAGLKQTNKTSKFIPQGYTSSSNTLVC